jgi:hypothetical protein
MREDPEIEMREDPEIELREDPEIELREGNIGWTRYSTVQCTGSTELSRLPSFRWVFAPLRGFISFFQSI